MQLTDYVTVFGNLSKNFLYLKADFTGIGFDIGILLNFIASFLFTFGLALIYFLIGKKIKFLFFRKLDHGKFNNFVSVALGYIFVNSGLAILGLFSWFYPKILITYLVIIAIIALFPLGELKNSIYQIVNGVTVIRNLVKKQKWVYVGIFLFVLIAFLRLIPPEIGEDAVGYHTGDPSLFLKNHTTIIKTITPLTYVIPVPHLGEMSYALSESLGIKDSARYIHFSFYFVVVFLLTLINPYAALFFVTTPVVIQVSSKANIDFQWILCWLLSIVLVSEKKPIKTKDTVLIGILFGGVLASKMWTIAFLPLFILYFLIHYGKFPLAYKLKTIFTFSLSVFLIDSIWLWRSFVISGNPVYPMLSVMNFLNGTGEVLSPGNVIGFNYLMFDIKNLIVFSPLFYIGMIIFVLSWNYSSKLLKKFNLSLFFILLAGEYLIIRYHFGRYLLGLYSLMVIIIALGIKDLIKKSGIYRISLISIFFVMFTYYFVNTLFILPYGFGWADANKYLTRILYRDNQSYFNFNNQFDKWITGSDKVATYAVYGYYYANFDHIDINNIFKRNKESFDLLKKNGVTKLLIRGGDIEWFCKKLDLTDCSLNKVSLLSIYSGGKNSLYLYDVVKSF